MRLEPADLVKEHLLPKVKGSFRIILDEEVTGGLSRDDQAFLVQAKEPQESSSGVSWVSKRERVVGVPAAQHSSSGSPHGGAGRRWTMHCSLSLCL